MRFGVLGCAVLVTVLSFTARAGAAEPLSVTVPVLQATPHMRGVIDASWAAALKLPVAFDFTFLRAGEPSSIYVAQDPSGLDFAFDAAQSEPLTASAHTNGAGVLNDDYVSVYLYPQGTQGFQYAFGANAFGARYQSSSENSAYAPQWTAAAERTARGYSVTMHIPFDIMRSDGSHSWKAQFTQSIVANGTLQVWSHRHGQQTSVDPVYAGLLNGIAPATQNAAATRPLPRLQLYALGEATTPQYGGNTSRVGADVSIPVTPTSSFVGTFHPDYSNVEIDQQTISPTAFQRQFQEVRPFFTQVGSNFNSPSICLNCPTILYTPAIPTFRDGYAYEGTQGPYSFAAFNAAGNGRSDNGETLTYNVQNDNVAYAANVQHIAANLPGFDDNVTALTSYGMNQRSHVVVALNVGSDSGTNVTDSALGQYFEYSLGYTTKTTTAFVSYEDVGAQFSPVDGYVMQPDVEGLLYLGAQTFNFSPTSSLHDIVLNGGGNRQYNRFGGLDSAGSQGSATLDFKDQLSLNMSVNATGLQVADGEFLPFNQNGFALSYKGATSTPTRVTYNGGPYYHGYLTSWAYLTTQPVAKRLTLSVEADENAYASPFLERGVAGDAKQWLERASIDWQFSRETSFDFGMRRIIGRNLPNSFLPPDPAITPQNPDGTVNGFYPFDYVSASNVSAAFHFLAAKNEFYIVYGDPNSLSTTPALFFKWIRYLGAEKGT